MKQAVSVIVLLIILACSASVTMLSSASSEVAGVAPQIVRELRQTDTLDELQQFEKLERPSPPIWPFVLALAVSVGITLLILGTPFLKQLNSFTRQLKRARGGRGRSNQPLPPASYPITLPPNFDDQPDQRRLPPPSGDSQW